MRDTLIRILLVLGLGCALWTWPARAQTAPPPRERPKLKEFGKSVERLKWDKEKGAAVEKPGKEKQQKGGAGGEEDEVVRVETSLVVTDVLVIDSKGQAVSGLKREDFLVREDGQPQEVGTFSLGDDARVPRTIVLIIDYSGSQLPYIKMSVAAAKTLVDRLGPRDLMALVTDDVEMIADFTADKALLKRKLDGLAQMATDEGGGILRHVFGMNRHFGRSAQFSALMATLKEAFDEEDVRPVIIFQTDGDELWKLRDPIIEPHVPPGLPPDEQKEAKQRVALARNYLKTKQREFSLRDVYTAAEKSRATIYTVVPGYRLIALTFAEQLKQIDASRKRSMEAWHIRNEQRKRLDERYNRMSFEELKDGIEQEVIVQKALVELSGLSGGWADFLEEPEQAADIYERIFSDVNRRYVIGFYPTNKAHDGGRRRVTIEVLGHPEYTVWGRKSYYAPGPEQ